MNIDEKIARINELYHKSQKEGLTEEEKKEQKQLRQDYIDSVRKNLRSQLNQIVIEKPDGTEIDLGEKYGKMDERRDTAGKEAAAKGNSAKEKRNG